ncbi:MAG: ABC-type transport system substrate-binding protein [Planctomycetota bacterium]|jgi:ABC-type transport system substrate-binding protein
MRLLPIILIVLLALFSIVLGLTVMWSSSSGAASAGASMPGFLGGKPQGHVYCGATGEPSNVNPFTTYDLLGQRMVLAYTHDALLDRDPKTAELRPALAEEFEVAADGLSCTFTMREGVVFADGVPVTMADVLFGWALAKAGHLPLGYVGQCFQRVAKVDSLDERRFRVHFKDRHFAALAAVGLGWIVAKKAFFVGRVQRALDGKEAMPAVDSKRFATLLTQIDEECGPGTGPYSLHNDPGGVSNWRRRQELLLTRNERSWRRTLRPGTWNFEGMRILVRDPAGQQNALLRGEVDWFYSPQLDQLLAAQPRLASNYQKFVYDYPKLGCWRILWNCKKKPFDDVRVRQAMGMLVNRAEVEKVFGGSARPAAAHAKFGSRAYPDLKPTSFDPSGARKLLREAGFDPENDKPLRMTLLTYQGSEPARRMAELFAGAAKQAGIELDVQTRGSTGVVAAKKLNQWHGLLQVQHFDSWGDPHQFLHSEGLENDGKWSNPDADRLATEARLEFDPDRRADLWRELHELAHREQPATLIVHPLASMLFNKHIEECSPGPLGLKPNRAWVAPQDQRK